MRLVLVEWLDSYGCSTRWAEIDEDAKPKALTCSSVGWLLYDGDDCKVIVPHLSCPEPDQDVSRQGCGDMTIPTAAIVKMGDITPPFG